MAAVRVFSALRTVKGTWAAIGRQHVRKLRSEAQRTPGQWQLVSAVCLQRPPVITAELTPLEQQYKDLLADLELESSILSDHEIRVLEDRVIAEKKQAEEHEQGEGEVEGSRVTALDLEDTWEAEAKEFTQAARVTEADKTNNSKSVDRKLDQPLFLLIKQTFGDKSHWVFPQGPRQDGESMRQAAERVLQTHCGEGAKAQFLGNAPCGYYQYTFPQSADMGTGAKVFFFKAWYKEGEVLPNPTTATDYMWVTMDQLPQFCSRAYLRSIKEFLVNL
ncbi:large ribosomal subunit protein mL46-like [Babylonia areolata]|uniref:large ribosomal subunit protein mL46-like n=1 Tax=Babylonia areolata TaxID=304850 RepID=UPI003FD18BE4